MDLGGRHISEEDLRKLEVKMAELAPNRVIFMFAVRWPRQKRFKYFTEKGDEYKLDLLEGLKDGEITFYTQGEFY